MLRSSALFLASLSLASCLKTECANECIAEVISPRGTKKVVLFSRNCGTTTGFNTHGTILDRDDPLPSEQGSAFIIDHGSAKVTWASETKIVVTTEAGVRVFKKEPAGRGVTIEYQSP